jgi:serine/threonine protein phosphatase PrpC
MTDSLKDLDDRLFFVDISSALSSKKQISIRRCDDIVLKNDLKVITSCDATSGSISSKVVRLFLVNPTDSRYFAKSFLVDNELDGNIELLFPWLSSPVVPSSSSFSSSPPCYPLSVYLYTVRYLLRNPSSLPYQTSPLLHKEFRNYSLPSLVTTSSIVSPTRLFLGTGKSKCRRSYIEDVDFLYETVKINEKENISLFGVLDGHGGIDCANHVSEDIPSKITALLRQQQRRSGNSSSTVLAPSSSSPTSSYCSALFQTFQEIDNDFLNSSVGGKGGSQAGSTANICLFHPSSNVCYVANSGDTRAVLSHNGIAIDLSYDRKASDPEEVARIAFHGGFVSNGRVNGILAVSRAFGDYQIKRMKPSCNCPAICTASSSRSFNQVLIVDPEISLFFPVKDDQFMIIATDGLWDVMTSQQAVDFIHSEFVKLGHSFPLRKAIFFSLIVFIVFMFLPFLEFDGFPFESWKPKLNKIAEKVIAYAVDTLRSSDNITVMIALTHSHQTDRPTSSMTASSSFSASLPYSTLNNQDPFQSNGHKSSTIEEFDSMLDQVIGKKDKSLPVRGVYQNNSSLASGGFPSSVATGVAATEKHVVEDDDDLMDFLKDDSNF